MSLDVYVGSRQFAIHARGGALAKGKVASEHEALAAVAKALPEGRRLFRTSVRVWWSGGICRPFLLDLPRGAQRGAARQEVIEALASERTGLDGPCVVWTQDQRVRGKLLSVAVDSALWHQTLDVLGQRGVKVVSLAPWWSAVLNDCLRRGPHALVGVRDCDSLTVLEGAGTLFDSASTYAPLFDDEVAEQQWFRASLRYSKGSAPRSLVELVLDGSDLGAKRSTVGLWGVSRA